MQKAEVVELVRSAGDHVVLAIGDGANDVAMIQVSILRPVITKTSRIFALESWMLLRYN